MKEGSKIKQKMQEIGDDGGRASPALYQMMLPQISKSISALIRELCILSARTYFPKGDNGEEFNPHVKFTGQFPATMSQPAGTRNLSQSE
jgi:hypothetical protein